MRLERVSRPVVGGRLVKWIGRIARDELSGRFNPNRWIEYRIISSTELRGLRELTEKDIHALSAWLRGFRERRPIVEDVPVREAHLRRPGIVVVDLGYSTALTEGRSEVLDGLSKVLQTPLPASPVFRPGLMMGRLMGPPQGDNQDVARTITASMYDAPTRIALGGLQMVIRTDQGVVEL